MLFSLALGNDMDLKQDMIFLKFSVDGTVASKASD